MQDLATLMIVFGFVFAGFVVFVLYFIFKALEFTLVSVNLYKKMVRRQDAMVRLMTDIRDNTKTYQGSVEDEESENEIGSIVQAEFKNSPDEDDAALDCCYHCGAELFERSVTCPKCGKKL